MSTLRKPEKAPALRHPGMHLPAACAAPPPEAGRLASAAARFMARPRIALPVQTLQTL